MNRKTDKGHRTFEVRIEKLVYGGDGLGRAGGKVVFVPFSVPGDLLIARVVEEKKNFIRAAISKIIEPGKGRQDPPCPHFAKCGGCQWQHVPYTLQLEAKRQILEEMFHHHFTETCRLEIRMMASPLEYGYRSRARIQVQRAGMEARAGFFRHRSREIEDIEACPLFRPALNRGLQSSRDALKTGKYSRGVRQLELACVEEEGVWCAAEVGLEMDDKISTSDDSFSAEGKEVVLKRKVGSVAYLLTPSVFFQANDALIEPLVDEVCSLARVSKEGRALDLYSGVGLFALPLAGIYEQVVAIESSPSASRLCTLNAGAAGLGNIQVVQAQVGSWMNAAGAMAPAFDLILLDPPRIGAGVDVMDRVNEWAPETVIYVSCDPHTLCRDLSRLSPRNFHIDKVTGLDLFPQTFHFETAVRLRRH